MEFGLRSTLRHLNERRSAIRRIAFLVSPSTKCQHYSFEFMEIFRNTGIARIKWIGMS